MKQWYDGYDLKGVQIYNPRSVVMSLLGHDFDSLRMIFISIWFGFQIRRCRRSL